MPNTDKAFIWFVQDFSEGEGQMEKFAVRMRSAEDTTMMKERFEAAQLFNSKVRNGDEDLVWAETVVDVEEHVDDIETNTTAVGGEDWDH